MAEEIRKNDEINTEEIRKKYGRNAFEIISLLSTNPYLTGKEMAVSLSVSQSTIEKNISKLQKAGLLKRQGPTKGGYWELVENKNG